MAKPAPKGNFMQSLLIAAVVFLGLQMFMQSQQRGADPRPADQYMEAVRKEVAELKSTAADRKVPIATILKEWTGSSRTIQLKLTPESLNAEQALEVLRYQNELGMDVTAAQYLNFVQGRINKQAEKEKWSAQKKREAEIQALLLVADVQYEQGVKRNEANRQDLAFLTLQGPAH